MTTPQRRGPTRRAVLRGAGLALALPWLESLPAFGGEPASASAGPPKRFACIFFGNGVNTEHWWARGAGAGMELGRCLEPLLPLRERLLVINGLYHENARKGSIHSAQTGNILSGAPLTPGGAVGAGISVDQVIARHAGTQTRLPSLVLGCEAPMQGIHKGYSGVYSSHVSWSAPEAPVPLELRPSLAFDALFASRDLAYTGSLLDRVAEHARALQREIAVEDRRRLDGYLTSVREVETRVQRLRGPRPAGAWQPTLAKPDRERPADGIPADIREHMRLMCDLIVLGFRADATRVATLMLNRDLSGMFFPHLGLTSMEHHSLSHKSESADYLKATRFLVEQHAYLCTQLAAVDEGGRSILDSSCVLLCSSIWKGGSHDNAQVPVVLAGGLQGALRGGRVLEYRKRPDGERRMCSLFLALLDRYGIELERFGDGERRLDGV